MCDIWNVFYAIELDFLIQCVRNFLNYGRVSSYHHLRLVVTGIPWIIVQYRRNELMARICRRIDLELRYFYGALGRTPSVSRIVQGHAQSVEVCHMLQYHIHFYILLRLFDRSSWICYVWG